MKEYYSKNVNRNGEEFTIIYTPFRGDIQFNDFVKENRFKLINKHQPETGNILFTTRVSSNVSTFNYYTEGDNDSTVEKFQPFDFDLGVVSPQYGWIKDSID